MAGIILSATFGDGVAGVTGLSVFPHPLKNTAVAKKTTVSFMVNSLRITICDESPGSPRCRNTPRKVRTPKSKAVGNSHPEQSASKCNREQTANRNIGKGETVV